MTTRMPKFLVVFIVLLAFTAWAGNDTPSASTQRREFRQSKTYPYIFEPVPYLENGAPQPMRFEWVSAACTRRIPPSAPKPTPNPTPLPSLSATSALPGLAPAIFAPFLAPENANPAKTQEPQPSSLAVSDQEIYAAPAYPPPENAQAVAQQQGGLDMAKYPAEIVEVFKNPYNVPKLHKRLFDPGFDPAQPPATGKWAKPAAGSK